MKTYYHATALPNFKGIQTQGLSTSERGKNKFGLDAGVDYAEIYGSANDASFFQKPKTVHLAGDFKQAASYGRLIRQAHNVDHVVIYRVELPTNFPVKPDPEDDGSFITTQNIPAKNLSLQGFVSGKKNP